VFDEHVFPFSRLSTPQNTPKYTYESLLDLGSTIFCTNNQPNVQPPVFPPAGSSAPTDRRTDVDHTETAPCMNHAGPTDTTGPPPPEAPDAAHHESGDSTPDGSSSSPLASSSRVVTVPPTPDREHHMRTRLRAGKLVPKQRTDGTVTYTAVRGGDTIEPSSVASAL
jgi:hypothetical protein